MQDITSFHILILKLTGFQSALTLQNCKACEATKRANSPTIHMEQNTSQRGSIQFCISMLTQLV